MNLTLKLLSSLEPFIERNRALTSNNPIEYKTSSATAKGNRLTVSELSLTILITLWIVVIKILGFGINSSLVSEAIF